MSSFMFVYDSKNFDLNLDVQICWSDQLETNSKAWILIKKKDKKKNKFVLGLPVVIQTLKLLPKEKKLFFFIYICVILQV